MPDEDPFRPDEDPFRVVEIRSLHDSDAPLILVAAAAQQILAGDLETPLVSVLAHHVRQAARSAGPNGPRTVTDLELADGRRLTGVSGGRTIILGAPRHAQDGCRPAPSAVDGVGMPGEDRPAACPARRVDLRARFRALFLAADPGDLAGEAALRHEAITLLMLQRMASELLSSTGASHLTDVYVDDPPMLAALGGAT
jgi:hypothetical protein